MKTILIADTTLCRTDSNFSFKEKIETARLLERVGADIIELPELSGEKADTVLVHTVASFVKKGVLSVAAGSSEKSIELAADALAACAHPRIRIEVSVSPVGMEYGFHKKPAKMLEWISEAVSLAREKCSDVEFCALDATRAEEGFLQKAIEAAASAKASSVSVCDNASELFPDDLAAFAKSVTEMTDLPVGLYCSDVNGLSCAAAALALKSGISFVKTSVGGSGISLKTFAGLIKNCGENYGVRLNIKQTELNRTADQIEWIAGGKKSKSAAAESAGENTVHLDLNDKKEDVIKAAAALGYDLSEEDCDRVYEEFRRVAKSKNVGSRELEVIVATAALQVPAAYKIVSYVINNGNIISSSAQITLEKDGKSISGISIGDGPVDAAMKALELILGRHFELDDFQIQSVTEGAEAMGSALVKLRSDGRLFSGNGVSTDIIGASIRAYVNAVNKIVYEEDAQ